MVSLEVNTAEHIALQKPNNETLCIKSVQKPHNDYGH